MYIYYIAHNNRAILPCQPSHFLYGCSMYIYQIAHNRAIRPCHPSHSMPLALILPRGDQWYLLRKPLIRRDRGDTLSLLVHSYLSPEYLVLPPLLPRCSLDYLGWQLLNQPFLFYIFFSFHSCLPVSRTASTTILRLENGVNY